MDHALHHPSTATAMPRVHHVDAARPIEWLRRGWADLAFSGWHGLAYGAFVAGFGGMLMAVAWGASYLIPALVGGFLLVAPFIAIGLYAMSAQAESRSQVDAPAAMMAWRRNAGSIALFGLMLALALILWERVAAIIFALYFVGADPGLPALARGALLGGEYRLLLAIFLGAGAIFAAMVFTLSVVTAPMLLDRPVDTVTAALTSLRCTLANPLALLVWAGLIAALTAVGFATAMLGLIVIFPWLAHASWHAYRDLVE